MDKPVPIVWKIAALMGGAFLGALLARQVDSFLARHAQEQSDYDKARYAQGLGPVEPPATDQRKPDSQKREER